MPPSKCKVRAQSRILFRNCARIPACPTQPQVQGRTPATTELNGILREAHARTCLGGSSIPACAVPGCVPVRSSWVRLHPRNPGRAAFHLGSVQGHRRDCASFEPRVNREPTFADIPCEKLWAFASPVHRRSAHGAGSRVSPGLGASFQRCCNRTPQLKMNAVEANARPIDECTLRTVATTVPPGKPWRCVG